MTFWCRRCSEQSRSNRWMRVAVAVAEHLHLDMAWLGDEFLDQHAVVAEAGLPLALRARERIGEILRSSTRRIPLPPPPARALISTGIADLVGLAGEVSVLLVAMIARHDRHARLLHQRLGRILEAHRADRLADGPMKSEPSRSTASTKSGFSDRNP